MVELSWIPTVSTKAVPIVPKAVCANDIITITKTKSIVVHFPLLVGFPKYKNTYVMHHLVKSDFFNIF